MQKRKLGKYSYQPFVKIKYPLAISGTETMRHTLESMGFNRDTRLF